MNDEIENELKKLARALVQKPPNPNKPGQVEAKQYVMFPDALTALTAAYELGRKQKGDEGVETTPQRKIL